ncbi:hypothetical protein KY334_01775 [Candidatus Woesearchaeota archaeon]|nr:hypothetical protein [Candidatus Woesearchaeota archaeon]
MTWKDLYEKAVLKLGDNGYFDISNSKIYDQLDKKRFSVEFKKANNEFLRNRKEYTKSILGRLNPNKVEEPIKKNLEVLLLDEPVSFSNVRSKVCYDRDGEAKATFYYDEEGIIQDFAKNEPKLVGKYNSGAFILRGLTEDKVENKKPFLKGWEPYFSMDVKFSKDPSFIKAETLNRSITTSSYILDRTVEHFNKISNMLRDSDWDYAEFVKNFKEEYESKKRKI